MATTLKNYTNDGYKTMFSDGPETISNTSYQTLLKYCNSSGSEQYIPQNKKINLGMYHNNGNSSGNLIFGFLVYNEGSSSATIKNTKYTVRTAPSVDANSLHGKLDMSAQLERDFLNGNVSSTTTTIPAGSKKFIMSCKVPYKTLVIERAEITCNSNKCKIRAVCGPYDNASQLVNNFWVAEKNNGDKGRFSGITNYTQINNTVDYNDRKTFRLFSATKNSTENTEIYYYKPNGTPHFAGNFCIVYNITFKNISGKKITISPFGDNSSQSARIVMLNPNIQSTWYTTNRLDKSGTWSTTLGNSNSTTLKFLLPGANCGNIDFTIS